MPLEIKAPERIHEDFGDGLAKLISIVNKITTSEEQEIIIDFSKTKWLNPFYLAGLTCVINRLNFNGKRFQINYHDNHHINSYLDTIQFTKSFNTESEADNNPQITFDSFRNKTYVPITSFKTGSETEKTIERERILTAISQLLKNQLRFSETDAQPMKYFLSELTDNINEHSKTDRGYVFAQFYPNSNFLDLCICDGGQGIMQSYLNNPTFNPRDEEEAIRFAMFGKSTKNRPEARGFGITTTRNMLVNGLRGKIFIWSGATTFIQTTNKEAIVNISGAGFFQGTFIAIRIPTIISSNFNFYQYIER